MTLLGYALAGHSSLQHRIVGSAFAQLPVVGSQIQQHALTGNPVALAIGIVGALWTGIGVLLASERAMGEIWGVPRDRELGFAASRGRALGLLVLLGGSLLLTTALSGAGATGGSLGTVVRIAAGCVSLAANFGLFWLAFRLLTPGRIAWSCFVRGAALAAVCYEALQLVGAYYVNRVVRNASNAYGTFALVIGLLSWIYLLATVFLFAAETNVIATRRLWPRPIGEGDEPARRRRGARSWRVARPRMSPRGFHVGGRSGSSRKSGQSSATCSIMIVSSSRARFAPRQRCRPCPKATWRFGRRSRMHRSGSSKARGS